MVLKEYEKNFNKEGHICQIVCNENLIEDAINFSMNFFFNKSIKLLSMWKMNNDKVYIDKIGFKKKKLDKNKFIYMGKEKFSHNIWEYLWGTQIFINLPVFLYFEKASLLFYQKK